MTSLAAAPVASNPVDAPWRILELPVMRDPRGALTFGYVGQHLPFPIVRFFSIYDVPAGAVRGQHAHMQMQELIFASAGSFALTLDNGHVRERIEMSDPARPVLVPPCIWIEVSDFAPGTACTVYCDQPYQPELTIGDYDQFLRECAGR